MNKIDLNNRTAVVTGGVQGFGLAVVKRFIVSGAKVVIWDRDQKLLDDLNIDNTIKINIDISNFTSNPYPDLKEMRTLNPVCFVDVSALFD